VDGAGSETDTVPIPEHGRRGELRVQPFDAHRIAKDQEKAASGFC
jgi:hypothetical protein